VAIAGDAETTAVGTFGGGLGLRRGGDWQHVGMPDLPSDHVQTVAFDGRGRLCVGTRQGLAIRDEDEWRSIPGPPGPPGPTITDVVTSPQGDVWIGTFERGVGRLTGDRWEQYGLGEGLPSLEINALVDHRGVIWVATNGGVALYVEGRFAEHPRLASLRETAITSLVSDGEALWIGTGRGVWRLAPDGQVASLGVREGLNNAHVYALAPSRTTLWAGTLGGLTGLRLDGRPSPLDSPSVTAGPGGLSHNWINALLTRDATVWVGTYGGGVDRFDGDTWQRVFPAPGETLEINPGAACWLGDRAVFGTLDRGLLVVQEDGSRARLLTDVLGLAAPSVTAVHADGGTLWIGTTAGLLRVAASAL